MMCMIFRHASQENCGLLPMFLVTTFIAESKAQHRVSAVSMFLSIAPVMTCIKGLAGHKVRGAWESEFLPIMAEMICILHIGALKERRFWESDYFTIIRDRIITNPMSI